MLINLIHYRPCWRSVWILFEVRPYHWLFWCVRPQLEISVDRSFPFILTSFISFESSYDFSYDTRVTQFWEGNRTSNGQNSDSWIWIVLSRFLLNKNGGIPWCSWQKSQISSFASALNKCIPSGLMLFINLRWHNFMELVKKIVLTLFEFCCSGEEGGSCLLFGRWERKMNTNYRSKLSSFSRWIRIISLRTIFNLR